MSSKNINRQYTAKLDTGRDYITFEFYSTHRANSKANYDDAKNHYRRIHGEFRGEIMQTWYNKYPVL